jgi:AraC-like DNA-binding protein
MLSDRDYADPRVQRAIALIKRPSTSGRIDFRELAFELNLSSSRFRHVFTRTTGISPKRYLKIVRLNQANWLMKNTFLSVKEVMANVGCSDLSHFVRDYKTVFGETPSQSRWSTKAW